MEKFPSDASISMHAAAVIKQGDYLRKQAQTFDELLDMMFERMKRAYEAGEQIFYVYVEFDLRAVCGLPSDKVFSWVEINQVNIQLREALEKAFADRIHPERVAHDEIRLTENVHPWDKTWSVRGNLGIHHYTELSRQA